MKILFIIQGEGRGHLTQALSLRQKLMAEGHEIVGVLVGKSPARRLPDFFLNKIQSPVYPFESLGIGGRLPVIGAEDLFAELAIDGCAYEQNHQADEKGCHRKHTLLYAQFPGQILALS